MSNKKRKTTDAVEILHKTFIKGKPRRLRSLEKEREKLAIAEQIYNIRKQAGLSQKDLANLIGTRQSVISRLEDADYGRYSLEMLRRIAKALHCRLKVQIISQKKHAYA